MNSTARQLKRQGRWAFTLIELIIVIALTAILFALLLVPLISAIRYTQQAQIVTAAQDAARTTRERLTRELGSALFVFDGTSHPFVTTNAQAQPGDDRYTNFLNLEIPAIDTNGAYTSSVAHAYATKLDFALPKAVSTGATPTDPTTGDPISYRQSQNGSAIISNPAYVFPLAAGTTVIRYWIGLQDPTKAYSNVREGGKVHGNTDNAYILYRAQFQPYTATYDPATGKQNGVTINTALFATGKKTNADGQQIDVPELDDPDFFRYVKVGDVNWLDDAHAPYDAAAAAAHNGRVDKWVQLAKPVIPGPNIDLILLPHNADNSLKYDTATDPFPGVPHNGVAHDPVGGKTYPVVNTSVTFRPGTVSGDAVPGASSDAGNQGQPTLDQTTGYGYVPAIYTATSQSWSLPYHVSLYPGGYTGAQEYFDTQISSVTDSSATPLYVAGDLLEFKHTDQTDTAGTLVYNITRGYPLASNGASLGGTDFVPLTVNPDTGTLNFGTPSLPGGPMDRNDRNWNFGLLDTSSPASINKGGVDPTPGPTQGVIDLTKPVSSPTAATDSPLASLGNATGVRNAHIAPGGIRVTGPDTTPGPNLGQTVPYTEVNTTTDIGENQYHVDYAANTIKVSAQTTGYLQANSAARVTVVYDYQANMTPADPTKPFAQTNPYQPMQVKVDYQTRDLIDVSIGIRIYDISNNRAQVIPSETKIKIGNSNRG